MNTFRLVSSLIAVAVGLVLYASPASAQTQVSCGTAISDYLANPLSVGLAVVGTNVSSRNDLGFSSFTMQNGYEISEDPLDTTAAAAQRTFFAGRTSGNNAYTGYFHQVFTDRGNGDVDRSQFWVYGSGAFWLRSVTWGGSWTLLQNVTCYDGPQNQILVTGHIGYDFWTFVMQNNTLT